MKKKRLGRFLSLKAVQLKHTYTKTYKKSYFVSKIPSLREATQEYKADLLAQMLHRQRIHEAEEAEKEHEFQRGLWFQEQYNKKIQDILSRPISGTTAVHPFRRRERPCSNFGAQLE